MPYDFFGKTMKLWQKGTQFSLILADFTDKNSYLIKYSDLAGWRIENQQSAALKKNSIALRVDCAERQFYSFSGTMLIFSQAGTSAAFLWVPFLLPPKEMEQKRFL